MKGKLITFEGGDGCGKTTQLRLTIDYLQTKDYTVKTFREPGATKLGEEVRSLLLHPDLEKNPAEELFLYETARSANVRENIIPALEKGTASACTYGCDWIPPRRASDEPGTTSAYMGTDFRPRVDNVHFLFHG